MALDLKSYLLGKKGSGGGVGVYKYKGSCEFDELPEENEVGDVWNIEDDFILNGKKYPAGTNVAWTGTEWDALGGIISYLGDNVEVIENNNEKPFVFDGKKKGVYVIGDLGARSSFEYKLYSSDVDDKTIYSSPIAIVISDDIDIESQGILPAQIITKHELNANAIRIYGINNQGIVYNNFDFISYETPSNKVTSISSQSTDTQYPSAKCIYDLVSTLGADGGVYPIKSLSYSEPFVFAGKKKGLYVFGIHSTFYYKVIPSTSTQSLNDTYIMALVLKEDFPEDYSSGAVDLGLAIYVDKSYNASNKGSVRVAYPSILSTTYFSIGSSNYIGHFLVSGEIQTIAGTKTFSTIPKQSNTTAPTQDTEFTNKKYVDDKPTTYSGYDATKTQVLKNINGTLTWVDE